MIFCSLVSIKTMVASLVALTMVSGEWLLVSRNSWFNWLVDWCGLIWLFVEFIMSTHFEKLFDECFPMVRQSHCYLFVHNSASYLLYTPHKSKLCWLIKWLHLHEFRWHWHCGNALSLQSVSSCGRWTQSSLSNKQGPPRHSIIRIFYLEFYFLLFFFFLFFWHIVCVGFTSYCSINQSLFPL